MLMALRKLPQHRSQLHQKDESLKVCQATFAAGKQSGLYNSAEGGSLANVPFVRRDRRDGEETSQWMRKENSDDRQKQ